MFVWFVYQNCKLFKSSSVMFSHLVSWGLITLFIHSSIFIHRFLHFIQSYSTLCGKNGEWRGDIQCEVGVGALKEKDAGLGVKRKRSEGRGCIERKVCGGERGKGEGIYWMFYLNLLFALHFSSHIEKSWIKSPLLQSPPILMPLPAILLNVIVKKIKSI